MHEIFEKFVGRIDEVVDRESAKALFEEIKEKVLQRPSFSGMTEGAENLETTKSASRECEKFCYKTYEWLKEGDFKVQKENLEVKFGNSEDAKYPPLKPYGGLVELSGKIDRIDTNDEYFRIIDYKTGKASFDEKDFFAGKKLQLFLYAGVIEDKKLAGAYYLPVSDSYIKEGSDEKTLTVGKTASTEKVLLMHDKNFFIKGKSEFIPAKIDGRGSLASATSEETLKDYVEYAKKVSEKAIDNMKKGVIVASPYKNECEYCEFLGMCENENQSFRSVKKVSESTISDAVRKKEEGEDNV